jgi:hypothetical protein
MSIYDRDYMKPDLNPPAAPTKSKKRQDASYKSIPLWNRIRFRLWLLFHPRRKETR